jgi:hypothetical protein
VLTVHHPLMVFSPLKQAEAWSKQKRNEARRTEFNGRASSRCVVLPLPQQLQDLHGAF